MNLIDSSSRLATLLIPGAMMNGKKKKKSTSDGATRFEDRPVAERRAEFARVRKRYADRVPIVVEPADDTSVSSSSRSKFIVRPDFRVHSLAMLVKKRTDLSPETAVFLFVVDHAAAPNGTPDVVLPAMADTIAGVYERYRNREDGMLYFRYSKENTFG